MRDALKDIIRRAVQAGYESAALGPEEGGGARANAVARLTREVRAHTFLLPQCEVASDGYQIWIEPPDAPGPPP